MSESQFIKNNYKSNKSICWKRYFVIALILISLVVGLHHYIIGSTDNQNPTVEFVGEISPPNNCVRVEANSDSFGAWLRKLPLKSPSSRINLYNGTRKLYQFGLYRVIDLNVGDKDLQQCADVAIRLRSDFLLSQQRTDDIAFNFTSGDRAYYKKWIAGERPIMNGNDVTWRKTAKIDSSYENFQKYLNTIFMYAGSYSLSQELKKVESANKVEIGNCLIQGGFPGHVIIVVDVAIDTTSMEKYVMFAQGYTPAQDIHIVRNLEEAELSPWYRVVKDQQIETPEWNFKWSDLFAFE